MQTLLFGKPRVNKYHTHVHTIDTISYLLESNGFKIIHMEIIQPFNLSKTNILGKLYYPFSFILPNKFGRTIVVIAKKNILD